MQVNLVDSQGWCPLVYAAASGQVDAVSFLLQCDWSTSRDRRPTRNEALQEALVAAAKAGHAQVRVRCTLSYDVYWFKRLIYGLDECNIRRPGLCLDGFTTHTSSCLVYCLYNL